MKRILLFVLACSFANFSNSQTPCSGGNAGGFPCNGLTLQGHLTIAQMGGQSYGGNDPMEAQDSWGWTDPNTGIEYALVAMNDQTAFVDISDPNNPIYVGKLDSHTSTSWWRDIKVYNNHAYIVSDDNGNHGMQIFDLTNLRNPANDPLPINFTAYTRKTWGSGSNRGVAHNIVINEDTGFAYIIGTTGYANAGIVIFDLSNATNPTQVATISEHGRCHDAQVVTYHGPDTAYTGEEIMVGSFDGNDDVHIMNVSNKSNIINISNFDYTQNRVTHQGWFTEDHRFFIIGDEGDETGFGINTRTLVYDMTDLDNPVLHYTHSGATSAIDHNGYVKGNRFYLANYRAGVRVMKIDDLYNESNPSMTEVDYFDTHPGSNSAAFHGAWNVYPFFESGNIIVSDLDEGLIIVKDPLFDDQAPSAVCKTFTAVLDKTTGTVTIDASDIDDGSSDTLGNGNNNTNFTRTITAGQTTFTCADVGSSFNVTLTIVDDYGNVDSCTTTVTVAGEETVYQGGGSWSNGLPDVGSLAKISTNDYDTSAPGNSSFSACACEIDLNRTLTVGADDYIEIEKDITVNGSLIVNHTGSVVQIDPNAVVTKGASGIINVELTTPVLQSRDFMVMGSPMSNETTSGVFNSAFQVKKHNPSVFIPHPSVPAGGTNFSDKDGLFWQNYTGNIDVGEGYIVRPQSGYNDPANVPYFMTYTEGTLNNGDVTRPVVFNNLADNPDGTPNVYANPYASAIDAWQLIEDHKPLINEVYFWEHLTPPSAAIPGYNTINFSMGDISMYNQSGGVKALNDPGTSTEPNRYISTGQGFAIKAFASGSMTFTNSMRVTGENTTLRNPNEENIDKIWLQVKSTNYETTSSTLIAFNPDATDGLDAGFDSNRLATHVSLYSYYPNEEKELGIQTFGMLEESKKIPLGFTSLIEENTEYEISIERLEGTVISSASIYLYDTLENVFVNLTNENYTFRSNKGNWQERFTLLFEIENVLGPEEAATQQILVYPNPATDFVNITSPNEFITTLEIFDLRGRLLREELESEINTTQVNIGHLKTGIYFLHIHTEAGIITKKLIKE